MPDVEMVDPEWVGVAEAAARLDISVQAVRKALRDLHKAGSPDVRQTLDPASNKVRWEVTTTAVRTRLQAGTWGQLRVAAAAQAATLQPASVPALASAPGTSTPGAAEHPTGDTDARIAELTAALEDQRLRAELAVSDATAARIAALEQQNATLAAEVERLRAELATAHGETAAVAAEYAAVLAARARTLTRQPD